MPQKDTRLSQQGFTLIELIITIAIAAIVIVVAVPSFQTFLETNRLVGTSTQLYHTLQYARSEAIKQNTTVYVSISPGSSWCYGINAGATCSCAANNCGLGTVTAPNTQLTFSTTGVTGNSFSFEPNHGASNITATLTFTTSSSLALSVKLKPFGSLNLCSSNVSGYLACT